MLLNSFNLDVTCSIAGVGNWVLLLSSPPCLTLAALLRIALPQI